MAGLLQGDGERGVREGVARSKGDQRECGAYRFFELARLAQGTDEAVVRFKVCRIGIDGRSKGLGCLSGSTCCDQVKAALGKRFGD
jgi:hypothetical protein